MAVFEIITNDATTRTVTGDLIQWAADSDNQITGTETRTSLRAELRGQPRLAGFSGPMWGGFTDKGKPIIRYEDAGSYAALSF